ncbi:hypothetical protein FKM82_002443 [Ascaphus truei]
MCWKSAFTRRCILSCGELQYKAFFATAKQHHAFRYNFFFLAKCLHFKALVIPISFTNCSRVFFLRTFIFKIRSKIF